jgi:hypothetical protein
MATVKHDVWKNKEGLTTLIFAGDLGEEARAMLEEDYEIVHSFLADSHFDAMNKYYAFMRWGTYETQFEIDKLPYDLERLEKICSRKPS